MKMNTRALCLGALFCALTAVASQMIIPMQPVPFTFAMVAVYLCGSLLDTKTAFRSQMAFLLLGAVGAPVFSGFSGGLAKLAGPTGGYLIAYPLMALLIAWLGERWGRSFWKLTASMGLALLICYTFGTIWLSISMKTPILAAVGTAVVPFVPFDLLKVCGSAALTLALRRSMAQMHILTTTV